MWFNSFCTRSQEDILVFNFLYTILILCKFFRPVTDLNEDFEENGMKKRKIIPASSSAISLS